MLDSLLGSGLLRSISVSNQSSRSHASSDAVVGRKVRMVRQDSGSIDELWTTSTAARLERFDVRDERLQCEREQRAARQLWTTSTAARLERFDVRDERLQCEREQRAARQAARAQKDTQQQVSHSVSTDATAPDSSVPTQAPRSSGLVRALTRLRALVSIH
eukprot:CAMPEP_0185856522 /NCGR_PEP_ID=MMETSP1354-20130828/29043_1 /TAXON_ID=708628 /ORGANISM="Erythrolobus madagascarensis, Strain CCMP3276" /LENGTH=160 /DNA_ID=CAMNT_0028558779 /DNA_START=191 /DNA_END=673 /DNA_ORIENTATION=-